MTPYADAQRAFASVRSIGAGRSLIASRPAPKPLRDDALDDLHRTLYGTLHPAAALPSTEPSEEGEAEGEGDSWLEQNAVTAALVLLGAAALYAITRNRSKSTPLCGPAETPLPFSPAPSTEPSTPTQVPTP